MSTQPRPGSAWRRVLVFGGLVAALAMATAPGAATAASPQLVDRAVAAGIIYPNSPLASTPTWDATVVDYDNDGDQDFHIVLHMRYEGMLFRNNGNGTFTRVAYVPGDVLHTLTPRVNQKAQYIDRHACAWGDPNRDGKMDIACLAGRYRSNHVKYPNIDNELFLQGVGTAAGTFADVSIQAGVNEPCGRGRFTTFIDVNGDGWDDLFVGNQKERSDPTDPCKTFGTERPVQERYPVNWKSKLYLNGGLNADGTWAGYQFSQSWNTIGTSTTVGFPDNAGDRCAVSWDYNRDGRVDLLACGFPNRQPFLFRNNGASFTDVARTSGVSLAALNGVAVADLNGDGISDYVFSNNTGFFYRLGTATGISSTTVRLGSVLPSGAMGWSIAVGDINGDGRMDVYGQVGSSNESGNPDDYVYLNTGGMTFQTYVAPSAVGRADDVVAVRVGSRDGFVVLNGKLENPVPGPVQYIVWAG
ncbi:MAG: VCBS repeat-containing protein [Actinomycetes bacterium]